MANSSPGAIAVAQQAFQNLRDGLATGQWQPFLDLLTEDFTFWFPKAPFQGLNVGKQPAIAFFHAASQDLVKQTAILPERVTHNATTVIFEVRLEEPQEAGSADPTEETTSRLAALSFEVRGDKISAFRQYLLFFDPTD